MHGVNHLLQALTAAAAADNDVLQAVLRYSEREEMQEDIVALALILQERESTGARSAESE